MVLNISKAIVYTHNDRQFPENSIAGLIFFGTPSRGSARHDYGAVLHKCVRKMADRNSVLIKELQRERQSLLRLATEGRHHLSRYRVVSFYETVASVDALSQSLVNLSIEMTKTYSHII